MDIQLTRLGRLITTLHIRQLKGLIKPVLAIKKQHSLVMMMSRQLRAHLSKFKAPLLIKYKITLDHQCSMCNSRWGKFRIKWLILAHQDKYHRRLKKQCHQSKGFSEIQIPTSTTKGLKQQISKDPTDRDSIRISLWHRLQYSSYDSESRVPRYLEF